MLEAKLLETFQPLASGQLPARALTASSAWPCEVMRIPRYYGHRVDACREGWRMCLAMARVPGECLDSWLRKRAKLEQQDGPAAVRRGCVPGRMGRRRRVARPWPLLCSGTCEVGGKLGCVRQLGPTLSRISSHVWHRDVNSARPPIKVLPTFKRHVAQDPGLRLAL